jgi:polysaccharide chain length determinant protein (PEP-CTERM system associated)
LDQFLKELLGHLRGMWNRRLIGLVVAWAVAVIGFALAFALPEKYEASARVQVDTQTLLKPVLEGLSIQPNLDQQVALISRTLLNRGNVEKLVQMTKLDAGVDSNSMREELIDRLTRTIQISGNATSNLYVITYRDSNPQQAHDVVSSLLKIFFESSAGGKRQDSRSALKFLDEEIARYEQSLQMAEGRLKDFRLKYMGVPGQGGPANQDYFARISRLGDDIANAKLELRAAVESRDAYRRELTAQTSVLAAARSTAAPVSVPEIDARIASQKTKLDELLRSFTDEHPDVVGTRRVIAELELQRKQELQLRERAAATAGRPAPEPVDRFSAIQQIRVSLADAEAKVASAQSKLISYEGQYSQLTASGKMIPQVEAELAQLNRDYDIQKKTYTDLLARREATVMGANAQETIGEQFRVIDPPRVSPRPVQPTRLVLLAAAFVGALGAVLLASFIANELMPTFHSAESLSEATDRPLLGTLSMLPSEAVRNLRRRRFVLFVSGLSGLAASFMAVVALALLMGRAT